MKKRGGWGRGGREGCSGKGWGGYKGMYVTIFYCLDRNLNFIDNLSAHHNEKISFEFLICINITFFLWGLRTVHNFDYASILPPGFFNFRFEHCEFEITIWLVRRIVPSTQSNLIPNWHAFSMLKIVSTSIRGGFTFYARPLNGFEKGPNLAENRIEYVFFRKRNFGEAYFLQLVPSNWLWRGFINHKRREHVQWRNFIKEGFI